jgi:hypothetical protein
MLPKGFSPSGQAGGQPLLKVGISSGALGRHSQFGSWRNCPRPSGSLSALVRKIGSSHLTACRLRFRDAGNSCRLPLWRPDLTLNWVQIIKDDYKKPKNRKNLPGNPGISDPLKSAPQSRSGFIGCPGYRRSLDAPGGWPQAHET